MLRDPNGKNKDKSQFGQMDVFNYQFTFDDYEYKKLESMYKDRLKKTSKLFKKDDKINYRAKTLRKMIQEAMKKRDIKKKVYISKARKYYPRCCRSMACVKR